MNRVAVLIACHNRKEKTLLCLGTLFKNILPNGYSFKVFLVDDGSSDGTEQAVRECYPQVDIINGDGTLFWNRAMHKAYAHALKIGFDAYLWLNDDTLLYPNALQNLFDTWQQQKLATGIEAIYVGSTQDSKAGHITYGGLVRYNRLKPFRFSLVQPDQEPFECHTMNGNCVLVTHKVAVQLGNLDPCFAHAMGDIDYGLRAGQAGIKVLVVPGYAGTCDKNPVAGHFNDRSLSARERWKRMMQPKGLPPASWRVLTRRHGGPFWLLYWLAPYLKAWF